MAPEGFFFSFLSFLHLAGSVELFLPATVLVDLASYSTQSFTKCCGWR